MSVCRTHCVTCFQLSLESDGGWTWTHPSCEKLLRKRMECEPGMVGYATMPLILALWEAEAGGAQ